MVINHLLTGMILQVTIDTNFPHLSLEQIII